MQIVAAMSSMGDWQKDPVWNKPHPHWRMRSGSRFWRQDCPASCPGAEGCCRTCHRDKRRRINSEWNCRVSVAFPDNQEVLLPWVWDWGCSSSSMTILLRHHLWQEPASARCNDDRFWWQDQVEDTWVLKTGQRPDFDDPSAKFNKTKASLWGVSEKRLSFLQRSFREGVQGLD